MKLSTQKKQKKPFPLLFISIAAIGILILFVPPKNIEVVGLFLFFVFLLVYLVSRFFLKRKFSILLGVFIVSLLLLLAANLFDTINAILLVSLFVGITILLQ